MSSSAKCIFFLYFLKAGLVNVFTSSFLDHAQCSYYHWLSGSFISFFYFQAVVFVVVLVLVSFSHQHSLVVFHWSLSDIKYPQVSRTLLSILADLSHVDWSTLLISNSISLSSKPFRTFLSAPITPSLFGGFSLMSKYIQFSWTFLIILGDLNRVVVWMFLFLFQKINHPAPVSFPGPLWLFQEYN